MTKLKEIGCFSIDSEKSTTSNGGHWSGSVLFIGGIFSFIILWIIFGTTNNIPLYGMVVAVIGGTIVCFTTEHVPSFRIMLNDNSKKYPCCVTYSNIIITKDIDEMTKTIQCQIDSFTKMANEKISENYEQKRINSCINDIEQKIITRIK
jgi:hypothetical protein